ncbi:Uncharacterised protein [uncultured archaeon]|nr:Uncharacterised protein [uncultured archaeon]
MYRHRPRGQGTGSSASRNWSARGLSTVAGAPLTSTKTPIENRPIQAGKQAERPGIRVRDRFRQESSKKHPFKCKGEAMGKVYAKGKHRTCGVCKPHKVGWEPKKKLKVRVKEKSMALDIRDVDRDLMNGRPDPGV